MSEKSDSAAEKPKGGKRKMTQKEQSERFKEAARQLDADETGEEFEKAVKTILGRPTEI